jgi:hypothetical protein
MGIGFEPALGRPEPSGNELNPEQLRAVEHGEGPLVVIARAGIAHTDEKNDYPLRGTISQRAGTYLSGYTFTRA